MNSDQRNISVLIPDGEIPMALRVVQCLSEIKGIEIYVLSNSKYTSLRFSRHLTKFIYHEKGDSLDGWFSLISSIIQRYSIDVVMPVFETAIRNFVKATLPSQIQNITLIPNSLDQYQKSKNKWLFHKMLEELGIPSPKSFDLADETLHLDKLSEINFPVIIKPKSELQGGGKGIIKFNTRSALDTHFRSDFGKSDYILQEYFEGVDLGCNVICKDGEIQAYTIQLGTLFDENEFKPQIGLKMIDEDNIYRAASTLMKGLEWTGVAHIDFLYNPVSKEFVVLEINPRYWLTLQASTLSGVNFPLLYCQLVTGEKIVPPKYEKTEYLELRGLIKMIQKNPLYIFNFRSIWNHTPIKYFIKDPFMATYHVYWSLKNKLLRKEWQDNL